MLAKLKYNIWVFFSRINNKREINKLKKYIEDLSWHIYIEKSDDPELIKQYEEVKLLLFINKIMLKGLRYDR
jgi:hypothetical protein